MSAIWTCLVRIRTNEEERSHLIEKTSFTIGRAQEADLPLVEPSVSRVHLLVDIRGASVFITDQKSGNGTFVNGQRIEPERAIELTANDVIRIGTTTQQFSFMAVPKPFELLNAEMKQASLASSMEELAYRAEKKSQELLEKELRRAKIEAEHVLSQARKEVEILSTKAQMDLQAKKQTVEAEILRMKQDAEAHAAQERLNAAKEADNMVAEAQRRIAKDFEDASVRGESLLREAQEKSFALLQDAEQKSRTELINAKEEAARVRAAAMEEARHVHSEAVAKHASTLGALQDAFHAEMEKKRIDMLERARAEAEQERERVIQFGAAEIERLREDLEAARVDHQKERERLENELNLFLDEQEAQHKEAIEAFNAEKEKLTVELQTFLSEQENQRADTIQAMNAEKQRLTAEFQAFLTEQENERGRTIQALNADRERMLQIMNADREKTLGAISAATAEAETLRDQRKAELENLNAACANASSELARLTEECTRASKELATLSKNMDASLQMVAQAADAEKRREAANRDLEAILSRKADEEAKFERESKDRRAQTLLDIDRAKREQEAELAKSRLKAMEDLKKAIEREEERYEKSKELRAMELGQRLNEKIIPELRNWMRDPENAPIRAKASIDVAVRAALLSETSTFQPGSIAENAVHNAAPVKKQKFDARVVATAVAVVVAVLSYFGNDIYSHFKGQEANNYASQVMEKRRVASVFRPEQTPEYRETYTDNILYMKGYFEAKVDSFNVDKWTLRLNDLALLKSMNLNEDDIVLYIGRETAMIKRLGALRSKIDAVYLKDGLLSMQKAEAEDVAAIKKILKGDENYKKIRELEKEFVATLISSQPDVRAPAEDGDLQ